MSCLRHFASYRRNFVGNGPKLQPRSAVPFILALVFAAHISSAAAVTAPTAGFSSASLSFPAEPIGNAAPAQTVSVSNSGSAALSISGIAITGMSINDFSQTNNCGTSLAAGAACSIIVTFMPTASGARYAGVTLTDNAAGSPQTISLTGTGSAVPAANVSTGNLTFASEPIGNATAAQVVSLSNPGSAALSISGIAITGMSINDFSQTNSCGTSLAAGAACSIVVTFKPTASGSRYAGVTLTDNAAGSPQTISLTGTGSAVPSASLSPGSLTFGGEPIGNAAAAQIVSLRNPGSAALSISGIAVTGMSINDFSQTNSCGTSLPAGAACSISVTFKPTASGARYAGVTFTDNAAGSPQTIALNGTGLALPAANVSPGSLTFASQSIGNPTAAQGIVLSNPGSAALSISSIAITGVSINDFSQANNCGSSLAAGSTCTISVIFTPTAAGARAAGVTLTDNAAGSPQTVSLAGTGATSSSTVSLSSNTLAFGNQPVDVNSASQTVTLTNTGTTTLNITIIALAGANASDFGQANTCNSSVAAGGNCTIAILFAPSVSGVRSATLTVADSATGSPQTVALSGTGTHDVMLTWVPGGASGIAGYNVYRGTASGGESTTALNSSPISGATFVDENVQAGQEYYYVVAAVNSDGTLQTPETNEASATVPTP